MAEKKNVPEKKAADGKAKKKGFIASVKGFFGRIGKYLKDTRSELKKVSWPSREETKNNTIVVIAVVAVSAVCMLALDFGFGAVIRLMIGA